MRRRRALIGTRRALCGLASACFLLAPAAAGAAGEALDDPDDLMDMELAGLLEVEITSVSKRAQPLSEAAAAVFVISREDLRRSGVRSIPEALRMVPGLHVARVDGNNWALSARGFTDLFSAKLLVLIDGRTVYTPLFSGVYWDLQDTLLEDVARIEVIRGPGATLWGANAVNGVINIITKSAKETQGLLLTAGGGNLEQGFTGGRWGGLFGDAAYRGHVKYAHRGEFDGRDGVEARDGSEDIRGGMRIDWEASENDLLTLQGDGYSRESGAMGQLIQSAPLSQPTGPRDRDERGGNLLARWSHVFSPGSDLSLQFYYDRTEQKDVVLEEKRNTWNLDFQHRFAPLEIVELMWGLGYRRSEDDTKGSFAVSFEPDSHGENLFSGFVQGELATLSDRLRLTLGLKAERNDYSGWEFQPSARALFMPDERHSVWAAISRAVRSPSRSNHHIIINAAKISDFPPPGLVLQIRGDEDATAENLWAFELGYRAQPLAALAFDIAAYYNLYNDLRTNEPLSPVFDPRFGVNVVPTLMSNRADGSGYGIEVSARWQVLEDWQLSAAYAYARLQIDPHASSGDTGAADIEGDLPTHWFSLRSHLNLPWKLELDASLYYVDDIRNPSSDNRDVEDYARVDFRLGWHPLDCLEFSFAALNAFDGSHSEWNNAQGIVATDVPRSFYGMLTWRY